MPKIAPRELTWMLVPALGLLVFGAFVSMAGRRKPAPPLVIQSTSIVSTGAPITVNTTCVADKRLTVLLRHNPQSWKERWKEPQFLVSGFDLLDESGRKYNACKSSEIRRSSTKHRYEVDYEYPLQEVVHRMPPTARRLILKAKVLAPDGWTLPVSVVVYRRK